MKAEEGIASKPCMYYDVGYTYPILNKNISKALLILPSSRSRPIIWCVSSEAFLGRVFDTFYLARSWPTMTMTIRQYFCLPKFPDCFRWCHQKRSVIYSPLSYSFLAQRTAQFDATSLLWKLCRVLPTKNGGHCTTYYISLLSNAATFYTAPVNSIYSVNLWQQQAQSRQKAYEPSINSLSRH